MKTEIETEHPFTIKQLEELKPEQRRAIEAVTEYLTGNTFIAELTDDEITGTFNLLKSCKGCVPIEEAGEDLLNTIRKKFGAVYQVGMELAETDLKEKKISGFNFCYLTDPSYEDAKLTSNGWVPRRARPEQRACRQWQV
jgi:hypothetical protein